MLNPLLLLTAKQYKKIIALSLNSSSFDNISKWLRKIQRHGKEDVEKMILANKSDMEDSRNVSREQGETMAIENGICFFETSAKKDVNIERAFVKMTKKILEKGSDVAEVKLTGLPEEKSEGYCGCN